MNAHDEASHERLARFLVRERELAAQGALSSLLHDIGTPLQVLAGRAALAEQADSLEEARRHLAVLVRKTAELQVLLEGFARDGREQGAVKALDVSADGAHGRVAHVALQVGAWTESCLATALELRLSARSGELRPVSPALLAHALQSLVVTALLACEGAPAVRLCAKLLGEEAGSGESDPAHWLVEHPVVELSVAGPGALAAQSDAAWLVPRELARLSGGAFSVRSGAATLTWPCAPERGGGTAPARAPAQ